VFVADLCLIESKADVLLDGSRKLRQCTARVGNEDQGFHRTFQHSSNMPDIAYTVKKNFGFSFF
jgi:hypothetical protein